MTIIIYGSQYGTAKMYATELANRTHYEALSFKDVKDINAYDTIIYIGALYAGGVTGMKKTFSQLDSVTDHTIIIATVGLADPTDQENIDTIKSNMKRQLSVDVYEHAYIFHLRGGIDYSQLNFKHKTMMKLLYKKAVNLPEEKKTAEVRAMIDTYNQQVNFVDYDSLEPIIQIVTAAS